VVRAVVLGFLAEDMEDDAAAIAEPSVIIAGEPERLRGAG